MPADIFHAPGASEVPLSTWFGILAVAVFGLGVFSGSFVHSYSQSYAVRWWYKLRNMIAMGVATTLADPDLYAQLVNAVDVPFGDPSEAISPWLGLATLGLPVLARHLRRAK